MIKVPLQVVFRFVFGARYPWCWDDQKSSSSRPPPDLNLCTHYRTSFSRPKSHCSFAELAWSDFHSHLRNGYFGLTTVRFSPRDRRFSHSYGSGKEVTSWLPPTLIRAGALYVSTLIHHLGCKGEDCEKVSFGWFQDLNFLDCSSRVSSLVDFWFCW